MNLKIQSFGLGKKSTETSAEVLGGKGAGLMAMSADGLPVPPGFIIPTTNYASFKENPEAFMAEVEKGIQPWLKLLAKKIGYMPLLSVRSGARVSCPGMMDTILNVGLDNSTFEAWEERLGKGCVADSAGRLVEMYGSVVKGIERSEFEGLALAERLVTYTNHTGSEFPDFMEQLLGSIEAVFASWDNERAKIYRELNGIPSEWGTAVVVQAMVFGNMNDQSCTGVLFTRNPDSGEPGVTGEYLIKAQGEDVVAGIRTPDPLSEMAAWNKGLHDQLMTTVLGLEEKRKDMQDVEFTVQDGSLFILQTRNAKRSARAAVRLAVEFHKEGLPLLSAIQRVTAKQFDLAQQSVLDPSFTDEPMATGIPACSGVVTGLAVTSSQFAIDCKEPCILVTQETTPDDIGGMNAAIGVLTMTGGATSHAAVVARGMNKPCVVGLGLDIKSFINGPTKISIDGATGRVWLGTVPVVDGSSNPYIQLFREMMWKMGELYPLGRELTGNARQMIRRPELLYIPLKEAVAQVQALLKESTGELILDLGGLLSEHELAFFAPLFRSGEGAGRATEAKELLALLEYQLSEDSKKRLVVLTPHSTGLKQIPSASTLEALVMLDHGSQAVWVGEETPATKKVLAWKLSQGVTLTSFGIMTPGGYVTERQLIAELLS